MWGEGVDDTNFFDRVFPSVTAAAERMWSWDTEPAGAGQRLGTHRCSLVRAGVPVGPIGPGAPCGKVLKSDDGGGSMRRGWTAPLLLAMLVDPLPSHLPVPVLRSLVQTPRPQPPSRAHAGR